MKETKHAIKCPGVCSVDSDNNYRDNGPIMEFLDPQYESSERKFVWDYYISMVVPRREEAYGKEALVAAVDLVLPTDASFWVLPNGGQPANGISISSFGWTPAAAAEVRSSPWTAPSERAIEDRAFIASAHSVVEQLAELVSAVQCNPIALQDLIRQVENQPKSDLPPLNLDHLHELAYSIRLEREKSHNPS